MVPNQDPRARRGSAWVLLPCGSGPVEALDDSCAMDEEQQRRRRWLRASSQLKARLLAEVGLRTPDCESGVLGLSRTNAKTPALRGL
jgi:hypothetical protein